MAEKKLTEVGDLLLRRMKEVGFEQQNDLAHAARVSASTISRLLYRDDYRPDLPVIGRLADALNMERDELAGFVYNLNDAPTPIATVDPIVAEIGRLLAADSPISPTERDILRTILDRVIDPYRRQTRQRRSAG